MRELVVDNFAGGGGASTGIEAAIGRDIDIAINHDPEAVAMHAANHPRTRHYCEDVWQVDPREVTQGRPVGLAWFSPDCKHFSRAKGGKPVSKKVRGLAWVVIRWAKAVRPRVIMLENVSEFATWGPLLDDGRPCQLRKGFTFRRWHRMLENLGYTVEMRELSACDYGAPTTRKRLFIIARCDGEPIVWPAATHGFSGSPYRTAAECIDWSIPCPSIFERARPLADATMRRIARGIDRYVIRNPAPFIVTMRGSEQSHIDAAARPLTEPLRTLSASGTHHALVAPTMIQTGYGERQGQAPRTLDLHKPLGTVVSGQKHALVAAFLARHYGGHENDGASLAQPMFTVTAKDHHALVSAFLIAYYGTDQDTRLERPLGTVTTKDRFGLVTVAGGKYYIADIGMRMLAPRELFAAQGFPGGYRIDPEVNGRPLTRMAQVRMAGNSVSPVMARALTVANYMQAAAARRAAA